MNDKNNLYNNVGNVKNMNTFAVLKAEEELKMKSINEEKKQECRERQLEKLKREADEARNKSWADMEDSEDLNIVEESSYESEDNEIKIILDIKPEIKSDKKISNFNFSETIEDIDASSVNIDTKINKPMNIGSRRKLVRSKLKLIKEAEKADTEGLTTEKKKKTKSEKKEARKMFPR